MSEPAIEVRGGATDEELAAVVSMLGHLGARVAREAAERSPYEVWRQRRLAVIRDSVNRLRRG